MRFGGGAKDQTIKSSISILIAMAGLGGGALFSGSKTACQIPSLAWAMKLMVSN